MVIIPKLSTDWLNARIKKMTQEECSTDISEFAKKLAETTRDQRALLKNLFTSAILNESITRSIRLHVLKSDHNGRPQVGLLVRELCKTILDYCIPRKQILKAIEDFNNTRSTKKIVALRREAQTLFTDVSSSGEGGELLLFILTESVLGYPQVLSKMAIKTSSKMHFHGVDGVYLSCSGMPATLRLHFGESKLHKSAADSVKEATSSIASMLTDEGFLESARRDYYLLNTQADLGSDELEEALKGFLDPSDPRFLSPEVCAVLLAGHELAEYPSVLEDEPLPETVLKKANNLTKILEKKAREMNIHTFHIDLFLVPFPNIQVFRDLLLKELCL
jgi:hypothetical protein